MTRREEKGQVTVLIIGFFVVAVLLVAVVTDASAAYLHRQAMSSLADGAALAAADGVQGEQVYTTGLGERAIIDRAAAESYAAAYLAAVDAPASHPGLRHRITVDGDRVVVHVGAPADLPFPVPGVDRRPWVGATAAAVVLVAD